MIHRFAIRQRAIALGALSIAASSCHPSTPAARAQSGAVAGEEAPAESPAARDTVRIDGSNGVLPLVQALAQAYHVNAPSEAIVIGAGLGSRARLEALAAGRIDVAVASHGLDAAALARDGLEAHRIAITPVVIGAHAGVPVRGVSEAQLCDLLTGRSTSWVAPGGETVALRPHMRPESEVDTEVVRAEIACLRDAPIGPGVTIAEETGDMARALAATPGAVGVTTATVVQRSAGKIRALALEGADPTPLNVRSGRYRLTRASYLVTRTPHSAAVARFLAFVRGQLGELVLTANGSLPAR